MPRLKVDKNMETAQIGGMQKFTFSKTRINNLGATEYTLVDIMVDVTGSTHYFADDLRKSLIAAVESCQKSPRSDNLLLRVSLFSTYVGGVQEIHGYKPLAEIDTNDYPVFDPDGMTPLYDAAFSGVGAQAEYGAELMEEDFLVNGIVFIITDGFDNASTATPAMIKDVLRSITVDEKLESIVSVLVGINAQDYKNELDNFKDDAGIDKYIDAGDATKGKLAKLAEFVSQSVSSQSQAIGTGGPSQNISATI